LQRTSECHTFVKGIFILKRYLEEETQMSNKNAEFYTHRRQKAKAIAALPKIGIQPQPQKKRAQ
jgi:hypothetical protein